MIKVKTKDFTIEVNTTDKTLTPDMVDSVSRLCQTVAGFRTATGLELLEPAQAIYPFRGTQLQQQVVEPEKERASIRERLPNVDSNKLKIQMGKDIKEIDIEAASRKPAAMPIQRKEFRCPHCGQSHIVVVEGQPVLRILDAEEPTLASLMRGEYSGKESYDVLAEKIDQEGVAIVESTEIDGFCPKCSYFHTLTEWIDAWDNPLNYFEYENPCPLCGSESVMAPTAEGTNGTNYACEKEECRHEFIVKEAY